MTDTATEYVLSLCKFTVMNVQEWTLHRSAKATY